MPIKFIEDIIKEDLSKNDKLAKILKYIFCDLANVSQKKYFILGSYAIRKSRTISDLDINMDYDEFYKLDKLIKNNLGHLEIYNNQIRYFFDLTDLYNKLTNLNEKDFSIEAFQKSPESGFPNSEFGLKYLVENNGLETDKYGHQFFSLKTLLKWKQTMNREKDKSDIELIMELINQPLILEL